MGVGCEDSATPAPSHNVTEVKHYFSWCAVLPPQSGVHISLGSPQTHHAASLPRQVWWQMETRFVYRAAQPLLVLVRVSRHNLGPREFSADQSLLAVTSRGAPRPLGVDRLAMQWLSLRMLVRCFAFGCTPTHGCRGARCSADLPVAIWPYKALRSLEYGHNLRGSELSALFHGNPLTLSFRPTSASGERVSPPETTVGGQQWGGWA